MGRICWFSSESAVIYTALEMLLPCACVRDGVERFALMPVREEQQPASNSFACRFMQDEQNESQRGDGAVERQLRLRKALLLKQGHVVREIVRLLPFIGP